MVNRKFIDQTGGTTVGDAELKKADVIKVHHVPFKLEYEGQANVEAKFNCNTITLEKDSTDSKVLQNQFRGRPLQGQHLTLPKNYEGLVVTDLNKKGGPEMDDKEESDISLIKRFDSVTYWNWDKVPSGMDKHIKLMDWIDISEALHEPV